MSQATALNSNVADQAEASLDERRTTVRMSTSTGPVEALLRVGQKKVSCTVLDESAGGFLISGRRFPKTAPNVPVLLITTAGTHPLRVVWRRKADGETRMGLQRLPEGSVVLRQDSSWIVWLILALLFGFGGGYYFAFRENAFKDSELMRQIFVQSQERIANTLADSAVVEPQKTSPPKADN